MHHDFMSASSVGQKRRIIILSNNKSTLSRHKEKKERKETKQYR